MYYCGTVRFHRSSSVRQCKRDRTAMIDILLSAGEARMRAQLTFLSPSRLLYKDLSRASRSEDLKFLKLRP